MSLPSLRLKANADRRLRAGHLWVYSNEVDVTATPLQGLQAGQQAILEAANGKPLGIVALSPNNLICARLLSRDIKLPLDKSLLVHRLNVALSLRERLFDKPCYRLVYGDSDLLPGLVVDRFFDILVVQLASATIEQHKDDVIAALVSTQAKRHPVQERLRRPRCRRPAALCRDRLRRSAGLGRAGRERGEIRSTGT